MCRDLCKTYLETWIKREQARSGNPRGEYQLSPKKSAKSALLWKVTLSLLPSPILFPFFYPSPFLWIIPSLLPSFSPFLSLPLPSSTSSRLLLHSFHILIFISFPLPASTSSRLQPPSCYYFPPFLSLSLPSSTSSRKLPPFCHLFPLIFPFPFLRLLPLDYSFTVFLLPFSILSPSCFHFL